MLQGGALAARAGVWGPDSGLLSVVCAGRWVPAAVSVLPAPGSWLHAAHPRRCFHPLPLLPPVQATALATIGKFIVKKKVGEGESIFGSVTTQELVEAIRMQTGRELDRKAVSLPEIKTLGTYEATGAWKRVDTKMPAWALMLAAGVVVAVVLWVCVAEGLLRVAASAHQILPAGSCLSVLTSAPLVLPCPWCSEAASRGHWFLQGRCPEGGWLGQGGLAYKLRSMAA